MKKLGLIVAMLLVSGVSQAAQFTCSSGIFNYQFNVDGTIAGAKISGPVHLTVIKDGQPFKTSTPPVSTSSFVVNQTLNFTSHDADSTVTVAAQFESGRNYVGTMTIDSNQGGTPEMSTTCTLR